MVENKVLKVGFQGRLGAYSESACLHLFGEEVECLPHSSFEEVYVALIEKKIDFAVLPFENSTTGSIHENFDLIRKYPVEIQAEVILQIEHALLAPQGKKIEDLKEVRSHPQALAQCSQLFKDYPNLIAVPDFDTAGSAENIAKELKTKTFDELSTGAIASELAGFEYGLEVLKRNVENVKDNNFTRFFCLSSPLPEPKKGDNKISLIYIPKNNQVGTLYHALGPFASRGIDFVKVESRPRTGKPWEYIFYLDILGNLKDEKIQEALGEVESSAEQIIVLGNYPKGETKKLFTKRKIQG